MDFSKDFYQILELGSDASEEEIRDSYRKLAKKYHPDNNSSSDDIYMFQLVQSAWDILGDPVRKVEYDKKFNKQDWEELRDKKLSQYQKNSASSGDAKPVFNDSWSYPKIRKETQSSNFIGRLKTIAALKPSESGTKITERTYFNHLDQEQSAIIQITPLELWFGVKKDIEINSVGEKRKIRVKIPKGFVLGSILNIKCPQTEIYPEQEVKISIQIKQHPKVEFQGLDITINLPISYADAILGNEMIFPTPYKKIKLKIPSNFEIGKKIKLAGLGIEEQNKIGDLYIKPTLIELPKSDMLIKILERLEQLYPEDIRAELYKDLNDLTNSN